LLDLPVALIKARIARGLSQSALAELLGVSPQQVQRWETERYRKVAFERLSQIARALNVSVSERIDLSAAGPVTLRVIRQSLQRIGFTKQTIEDRILPHTYPDDEDLSLSDEVDARISLLLGTGSQSLASGNAPLVASQLRFKLPASASQTKTRAYSCYVEAVCRVASKTSIPPASPLPVTWQAMRELLFPDGIVSFKSALNAAWKAGVHDSNVPVFHHAPLIAGAILYIVAFGYAIFYNYNVTGSAMLAISTGMLQQLAVLGAIFLFLRRTGTEANRGR